MSRDSALLKKIERREALVGVIGLGYVGLPLAAAFAEAGFRVFGFDVDRSVVDAIAAGESHVTDVSSARVGKLVSAGGLEATTAFGRLSEPDAIVICVPTPLSKTDDPDLSYVLAATDAVCQTLRPGQLVVLESTTYPGATRELLQTSLERTGLRAGEDFFVAFSPERVDPGNPVWRIGNTPKIVGGLTPAGHRLAAALYRQVVESVVEVSSPEVAEMAKLLENTFRAVNIGLVNEMAVVADRLGIDVWEVIEAAATKPFGFMPFFPGPGLGGHCIPVDPLFLAWKMRTLQYRARLIELAAEVNSEMPRYVAEKVGEALNRARKPVNGSRILVLGVSYKPDVADTRESPALDIMRLLAMRGAEIEYHDPYVAALPPDSPPLRSVPLTAERIAGADVVLIATDHECVDYSLVARHAAVVVDPRNALVDTGSAVVFPIAGPPRERGGEQGGNA